MKQHVKKEKEDFKKQGISGRKYKESSDEDSDGGKSAKSSKSKKSAKSAKSEKEKEKAKKKSTQDEPPKTMSKYDRPGSKKDDDAVGKGSGAPRK